MKNKKLIKNILLSSSFIFALSCTDLEEKILDGNLSEEGKLEEDDIAAAIGQIKISFFKVAQGEERFLTLGEHSTDALAGPTRGGDWDDNSKWRQMHTLTWTPANPFIDASYNDYMTGIYNCDIVINNNPKDDAKYKTLFYKAYFYYHVIDKWGRVPYREAGSSNLESPKVYTGAEATTKAMEWLKTSLTLAPEKTTPTEINKDAINMLLAKFYLNKVVFDSKVKKETYTFSADDMTKVIEHIDAMSKSSLTTGTITSKFNDNPYWANFAPDNSETSGNELILTCKNDKGTSFEGSTEYAWRVATHYNQKPDGFNGWSIPAEFYDTYDPNDQRIKYSNDYIITNFGNPVGMQIGQIYEPGGTKEVKDRLNNKLIYTKKFKLVNEGSTIETVGIRPMKYIPDEDINNPGNDGVVFRYADALLMRAEASLRGGKGGDAQADLDAIRDRVGLNSIPATLENVYAERGRELWFEGWRREDMIRMGTFLNARELKPKKSEVIYALYPFPVGAILNPNLTQNPGY